MPSEIIHLQFKNFLTCKSAFEQNRNNGIVDTKPFKLCARFFCSEIYYEDDDFSSHKMLILYSKNIFDYDPEDLSISIPIRVLEHWEFLQTNCHLESISSTFAATFLLTKFNAFLGDRRIYFKSFANILSENYSH
jgi:hypothetical protein